MTANNPNLVPGPDPCKEAPLSAKQLAGAPSSAMLAHTVLFMSFCCLHQDCGLATEELGSDLISPCRALT